MDNQIVQESETVKEIYIQIVQESETMEKMDTQMDEEAKGGKKSEIYEVKTRNLVPKEEEIEGFIVTSPNVSLD